MICEIIRGIICAARAAETAREIADESGFACDQVPCFKERDDDDENEEAVIEVKAEAATDPEPVKAEPAKKTESAKKAAPAKKEEPKKAAPAKKAEPAKKTEPAKKAEPAKKKAPKKEEKKEDKK